MSIINTISTECTPQQDFNFDEIFPLPKNNNEISEFNFLDKKPNPNYISLCRQALKLKAININNNNLIDNDSNDINLKRTTSYSDLKINMKKEEEFNLEEIINKKNITHDRIISYLIEEIQEKIFIEEDYKYDEEEELYYNEDE